MNTVEPPPAQSRYPRSDALEVAAELLGLLTPACVLMTVAGSLRRDKAMVGDVEILYVPLWQLQVRPLEADLFETEVDLAAATLDRLLAQGIISMRGNSKGRPTWGKLNRLAYHCASGIPVDFFGATNLNWFNYLVCRTGGATSNIAIAQAARAKGWKWHPYGEGFTDSCGVVHPAKSEAHVFELAGLPYLEPNQR